jgi:NAD(P)-dependent dehydrogenase (short-subunit alcohol dehydrogenase family)
MGVRMKIAELFNLDEKVAIVTGGSVGIGKQLAVGLAEAGAHVVITARKIERCEATASEIEKSGVKSLAVGCDISDADQVDNLTESVLQEFGRIDILVNNAGTTWGASAEDIELKGWNKVINTNITGTFLCSQRVGRVMIRDGGGKIINVASVAGFGGSKPELMNALPYNTSKGAVITFTKDLAVKWIRHNINVNAIAPGWFVTDMSKKLLEMVGEEWLRLIPRGRFGGEEDLKGAVVFLASKASDYVVGQVLVVDGGQLAW